MFMSGESEELSYTVEGDKLTVTDGLYPLTGQYSISGSKLYWDIDRMDAFTDEALTEFGITKAILRVTFNKK